LIPDVCFEQGAEKAAPEQKGGLPAGSASRGPRINSAQSAHSTEGSRLKTYFGGWRPGLVAHFSMFSKARSWLGRLDGFCAWGFCGGLFSLSIDALLCLRGYTGQHEAQMNNLLILQTHFTQLT
jgi:hypothetical protein